MNTIPLTVSSIISEKVIPIVIAIIFFGVLIAFHELGHFCFAKLFKVKVNEFALGMGPTLFKFQKGETKYALRLFPIGGFVSLEGEDSTSESEGSFGSKPAWQRFIIIAAGGTINLIMGIILVAVMLCKSDLIGLPVIHSFQENAVSSNYGLEAGDKILEINGKKVFSEYDMGFLMAKDDDGIIDFTVKRNGEKVSVDKVKFETTTQTVNGREMLTVVYDFIILGVEPSIKTVPKYSVLESVSIVRIVWESLYDLATGKYGISDLSGPVGTVSFVADAAVQAKTETDYSYLFLLMSLIAINVGIMNLLPLPALDGGRLFILLIEMIFKKKLPPKAEGIINTVGMVLLLALMAVITFSDIFKLIKGY